MMAYEKVERFKVRTDCVIAINKPFEGGTYAKIISDLCGNRGYWVLIRERIEFMWLGI